jgi:hypothetical protein
MLRLGRPGSLLRVAQLNGCHVIGQDVSGSLADQSEPLRCERPTRHRRQFFEKWGNAEQVDLRMLGNSKRTSIRLAAPEKRGYHDVGAKDGPHPILSAIAFVRAARVAPP